HADRELVLERLVIGRHGPLGARRDGFRGSADRDRWAGGRRDREPARPGPQEEAARPGEHDEHERERVPFHGPLFPRTAESGMAFGSDGGRAQPSLTGSTIWGVM